MRRLPPMGALEAFVIVAQNRTLTAASSELNLSVSAISRRIQALETYIGTPLFERLHHELKLTPDGERLVENAAPAFDALAQVLSDIRHSGANSLTIGVPPSFAAAWLLPRIGAFKAKYADIALSFDSSGAPFSRLGGSLDAAIVFAEDVEGDLYSRELKRQTAFAVCADGFLPDGMKAREMLTTQTLLLHSGLPKVLPSWLNAMGLADVALGKTEYYDSGPMLLAAAESGLGVALTLEDSVRFYTSGARLSRPFGEAIPTPYSYYFVCRRSALVGRALRRLHDWVFEEAAKTGSTLQ